MDIFARFENANPLFFGSFSTALTYLVIAVCLYVIANRKKEEFAWFAFVPFLNLLLMCKLAKMNPLWMLTYFFPPVGVFVAVYKLSKIAEAAGKSPWLGVGMAIPCVQLIAWPVAAFAGD